MVGNSRVSHDLMVFLAQEKHKLAQTSWVEQDLQDYKGIGSVLYQAIVSTLHTHYSVLCLVMLG